MKWPSLSAFRKCSIESQVAFWRTTTTRRHRESSLLRSRAYFCLMEPLSNLDARLRLQTREEIKRIQRETGITTVFVTHDQEEAMSISDEIVVMKDGVIQQMGEPQSVYDFPANLFVAKFLGNPQINVFEGEIKNKDI